MTEEFADRFAAEWLQAWNDRDLERILGHYADSIEFTSPFAQALLGEASGTVVGKPALRDYFRIGLGKYPDLQFTLLHALPGVASLTLVYRSVNDLLAAEVMEIDQDAKITRVNAHYRR
ncbi:DUF4440 domain-containing protein [Methylomonas sp. LWB]|uniref:nuclear transport factor 2 family protein n=1 Tax=Methylomonas sp. LWB TaxID=1905845 RepID=UPI0008DB25CC|nr:nuclear transport factor 2 family protein [Methylomonas sp. LWB]OHX35776.1 DUF4440 domain-containing protein [Methylomonas sp. LWB]